MLRSNRNSRRSNERRPTDKSPSLGASRFVVAVGSLILAFHLQTAFGDSVAAGTIISPTAWQGLVTQLGGTISIVEGGRLLADVPFGNLFAWTLGGGVLSWLLGSAAMTAVRGVPIGSAAAGLGLRGWLWWCLPAVWESLRTVAVLIGAFTLADQMVFILPFELAVVFAGWLATFFSQWWSRLEEFDRIQPIERSPIVPAADSFRIPMSVWIACGLYAVVFTTMNWMLYWNLQVPHGDSAMYEEHLWNVLHGKGFRSYLVQGLFLREHIQVVHLLLLPIYFFWPSHLLLELAQSLAVASCAIPVYWMTRRHTTSERAAVCLAIATLLYVPLQFLDIDVDLKTFRPITFGVASLLFALDQIERRRWKSAACLLVLTLSAKEDYSIVLSLLGVWIAGDAWLRRVDSADSDAGRARRQGIWFGGLLFVLSAVYLVLATRVLIPWFRSGAEVHYAGYFQKFGKSLDEVVINMVTRPGLLFGELLSTSTLLYALAMLVPLGFLPLLSPSRLAVAVPLFGVLCLNELARSPQHHFHAPLVPFVLWAAAVGVARAHECWDKLAAFWPILRSGVGSPLAGTRGSRFAPYFVVASALVTGMEFSLSPVGHVFWDSRGTWSWRKAYVIGERARRFERIPEAVPRSSRVASTDFVHPRFTHYERSYDYSNYRRRVSGYELRVPDDCDYIVIDCQHRYSDITSPVEVRELQTDPDRWELVPELTDEYFIVLKRKKKSSAVRNDDAETADQAASSREG